MWNKSSHAILAQVRGLETQVSFPMKSFHSDNGSEFPNWPLYEYLNGCPLKVPFTRRRAYHKNDNAHCEQKNWTRVRQLLGYERFEHPELVSLLNEPYGQEWSQYQNHFRPTFKLRKREKKDGKTVKTYETKPQTPYQRLLESPAIPEATKARLRAAHARLGRVPARKEIVKLAQLYDVKLGEFLRVDKLGQDKAPDVMDWSDCQITNQNIRDYSFYGRSRQRLANRREQRTSGGAAAPALSDARNAFRPGSDSPARKAAWRCASRRSPRRQRVISSSHYLRTPTQVWAFRYKLLAWLPKQVLQRSAGLPAGAGRNLPAVAKL